MNMQKIIRNNRDLFIIIALLLLNIALKSFFLTKFNIDLDEPFTLFRSQQTLKELFSIFSWENNPPLYFVLMHFWIKVFGISELSARLLPMLFSTFAVIYMYLIGLKFLKREIALSASLMYSLSNVIIMESHDCRVYSLLVLLILSSFYYFLSIIKNPRSKSHLVFLVISNVLLIYSHFFSFFIIFLQVIYVIFLPSVRKRIMPKYLLSLILAFILYLPYLSIFIKRFFSTVEKGISKQNVDLSDVIVSFADTFGNNRFGSLIFITIIFTAIFKLTLGRGKLNVFELMIYGLFCNLYLILLLLFPFTKHILIVSKYMIFIVPGFYFALLLSIYKLTIHSSRVRNALLVLCFALMIYYTDLNHSLKLESTNMVSYVKKNKDDLTLVYIYPVWIDVVFMYHYNRDIFVDYRNSYKRLENDNIYMISSADDIPKDKIAFASDIILIEGWDNTLSVDAHEIFRKVTQNSMVLDTSIVFCGYKVFHYRTHENETYN